MPAGNTYEAIATTTVGSGVTTVTFSSITSSYTDLVIVVNASLTAPDSNLDYRFNGDTGANYSYTSLSGNGSSASSTRFSNATAGRLDNFGYLDTTISTHIVQIMNYANTTTNKTTLSRGNNTANGVSASVNLWRSTAAVNSVSLISGVTFVSGSTFSLYGIASA
jgi:hypothetical protein